jgi:dienelactone hydrolase
MNFAFSPSQYYQEVADSIQPSHSYVEGDVFAWQQLLRQKVRSMLVLPQAGNFDLEAETLWQMEHPLGTIEKVVFQSEPGAHVVAYVCLPANVQPPYQYWICMQGHSTGAHVSIGRAFNKESETIVVEGDRDYGLECMRRGYAAICIEQRGFGERSEKLQSFRSDNFCHDASMQALLLGRTLMGQRVTDVDRTIDYLQSRGDALMDRIGVLGNSGGGTTSIFSAALLARVAYAMPSCSVCTMRSSLLKIFHCSCNFIPGLLAVAEIGDILGLAAPKPVVVIAGKTDSIFPIDGTREAFAQLERIYQAAGAGDRCRLVEGPEGHRFYAELGWEQMEKLMKNPSQTRN